MKKGKKGEGQEGLDNVHLVGSRVGGVGAL